MVTLERLYSTKKFDEFLQTAQEAVENFPNSFQIRFFYARVLKELRRFSEAEATLKILAASFPDNINLLLEMGAVLVEHEKFEEAEDCLNKILFLDPFNNRAKELLDKINLLKKEYGDGGKRMGFLNYTREKDKERVLMEESIEGVELNQDDFQPGAPTETFPDPTPSPRSREDSGIFKADTLREDEMPPIPGREIEIPDVPDFEEQEGLAIMDLDDLAAPQPAPSDDVTVELSYDDVKLTKPAPPPEVSLEFEDLGTPTSSRGPVSELSFEDVTPPTPPVAPPTPPSPAPKPAMELSFDDVPPPSLEMDIPGGPVEELSFDTPGSVSVPGDIPMEEPLQEPEAHPEPIIASPEPVVPSEPAPTPEQVAPENNDEEFMTESAAELYLSQGLYDDALTIYESLNRREPGEQYVLKIKAVKHKKVLQKKIQVLSLFLRQIEKKGENIV